MKKKFLLATGALAAIAVPFVSVLSCSSFFDEHSLFDEGNFKFDYINDVPNDGVSTEFNNEVVNKEKYLFGASLGATEVYNTTGTKPEIIGIAPEKALTTNGLFMSNTFSKNDMIDFQKYMQHLWWVSNWSRNDMTGRFKNKPMDAPSFSAPSPAYENRVLNLFEKGTTGQTIFTQRQPSLAFGHTQAIFNSVTYSVNTYGNLFKDLDMRYPKLYTPGSKISTTYGELDTFNGSLVPNENILLPTLLEPFHTATTTVPGGEIDFNEDGDINIDDIQHFLNIDAPYTYANYKAFDVANMPKDKPIRVVILDDAFVNTVSPIDRTNDVARLDSILRGDGIPLSTEFDGLGVKIVKDSKGNGKEFGAIDYLRDSNYKTIAIMPVTEWASYDGNTSSLLATYRIPARLSSLNKKIDENGKVFLDGSDFSIDESYALGLVSTYFELWINKPQSASALKRTNYGLDQLFSIILQINGLDWSADAREEYFDPLFDLTLHYNDAIPSDPTDSKFISGINYDFEKHKLVDDVESRLFSEGVNPFIYYSTNSDNIEENMEYNSSVIETRIMNSHGDGKINLRNEMILPINIALYKAESFGDAKIAESVKSWIEEHFTIE